MAGPVRHRRSSSSPSEVVASFATLEEAERALDFLADRCLALTQISLVARPPSPRGRLLARYGRVAFDRATCGAAGGAFVGYVLSLLLPTPATSGLELALSGITIGAVGGGLFGLCERAVSGGAGTLLALRRLAARRYDLAAAPEAAGVARRFLGELVSRPS